MRQATILLMVGISFVVGACHERAEVARARLARQAALASEAQPLEVACSAVEELISPPLGFEEVRAWLPGRWLRCGPSLFGSTDEAGLELADDGRWFKLYRDNDALRRGEGFDDHGAWELMDCSDDVEGPAANKLAFTFQDLDSFTHIPLFSANPLKLRFVPADESVVYVDAAQVDLTAPPSSDRKNP